jgi:curved DNA-binding protein
MSELFEMLFGGRTGRGIVVIRGEDLETETTISLEEVFHGASRLIQINGQTIRISIKPGISEGQVLRIAGKGGSGHGGGAGGDLYLRIRIAPHQTFLRDGDDLRADLPVDIYSAILGGKTGFVTLKGSVAVTIPKGTPNGRELRLRGLGMPVYGKKNAYGNLLLKVSIVLPERLTEEELHLFGRLAALRNGLRENIAPS